MERPDVHVAPDDILGQIMGAEPPLRRQWAIEIFEARGVPEPVIERLRQDDTEYYRDADEMKAVLRDFL
jgi:hypothetical protein